MACSSTSSIHLPPRLQSLLPLAVQQSTAGMTLEKDRFFSWLSRTRQASVRASGNGVAIYQKITKGFDLKFANPLAEPVQSASGVLALDPDSVDAVRFDVRDGFAEFQITFRESHCILTLIPGLDRDFDQLLLEATPTPVPESRSPNSQEWWLDEIAHPQMPCWTTRFEVGTSCNPWVKATLSTSGASITSYLNPSIVDRDQFVWRLADRGAKTVLFCDERKVPILDCLRAALARSESGEGLTSSVAISPQRAL